MIEQSFKNFIHLFIFDPAASSLAVECRAYSLVAACWVLVAVASLVVEHEL